MNGACPPEPWRRREWCLPAGALAKAGMVLARRSLGEGGNGACPPEPWRRRLWFYDAIVIYKP